MPHRITDDSYGKGRVRLLKVRREGDRSAIADLAVDVRLEGDFGDAYVEGDNTRVLPTDTMKNTVYAVAHQHPVDEIEGFAVALIDRFLSTETPLSGVRITISQRPWEHAAVAGSIHPHAFVGGSSERRVAIVHGSPEGGYRFAAGIDGLDVLKTTGSAFAGFLRDEYTTLPDAADRLLQTRVTARWPYTERPPSWGETWASVRQQLIEVFATHDESRSVQHTLWEMGRAVLDAQPAVGEITLTLPNRHNLKVDLPALGLEEDPDVLLPIDEPFGLIEATVTRG